MIAEGDWVLVEWQKGKGEILGVVDKINGQAYYVCVILDGEYQPAAICGSKRIRKAPIEWEPDPFMIDLALDTEDEDWFIKLRGTK